MEPAGLRRKDTTKGPPLRILSLDGGGVRGYSMLILLQELMYKTFSEAEGKAPTKEQIPKPCDYFDLIGGTGTGGLIAIMLGRLRLDLETCKNVYVRMTKRVFETDKTIAGIPYRSTLFKASKLEEAIKECVREHTIFEEEGNDGTSQGGREIPMSPASSALGEIDRRQSMASSVRSGYDPVSPRSVFSSMRWGNPNAYFYDSRQNRTKTAVTAVYKGTQKGGGSILLRSYDSRKEPAPEFNCTIWQAGRATSATGLAFKPIQIGQSQFTDEGAGAFNPAPQLLDEAVINEWPGRELGVFVSIGTGKRPSGTGNKQHEWWEGFIGGAVGSFAEARRRLIAKIEGCEETHQNMRREYLLKRGVNPDCYYRLNVEVGVGEFGMNEWNRLADISTSTRRYLAKPDVKQMNEDAATKLARIERAKRRTALTLSSAGAGAAAYGGPSGSQPATAPAPSVQPPLDPLAVELPGDEGRAFQSPVRQLQSPRYGGLSSPEDKFSVLSPDDIPPSAGGLAPSRPSAESRRTDGDARQSTASSIPTSSPRRSHESGRGRGEAPPLPPKTPIDGTRPAPAAFASSPLRANGPAAARLPYPDDDGPPPVVNMAGKPEFVPRP